MAMAHRGEPAPGHPDGADRIGRLHHLVIDCPDPLLLSRFYSALLGKPITFRSPDWVVVAGSERESGLAFQRVPGFVAPRWPSQAPGQQMHWDVMCDDIEASTRQVVLLGATRLDDGETTHRVFADPAGHPFCLVPRPSWAGPVSPS